MCNVNDNTAYQEIFVLKIISCDNYSCWKKFTNCGDWSEFFFNDSDVAVLAVLHICQVSRNVRDSPGILCLVTCLVRKLHLSWKNNSNRPVLISGGMLDGYWRTQGLFSFPGLLQSGKRKLEKEHVLQCRELAKLRTVPVYVSAARECHSWREEFPNIQRSVVRCMLWSSDFTTPYMDMFFHQSSLYTCTFYWGGGGGG